MFKIELGKKVKDKVTGLKGIVVARSEHLNMCNRYLVQPSVDKDMKVPDGWWIDEMQLEVIGKGVEKPEEEKNTGGLMGRKY